jgi:hypothetical protein
MAQLTPEQKTDLINCLFDQWRDCYRDLLLHKAVIDYIRRENPNAETALDKMLSSPESNSAARTAADHYFAGFSELPASLGEGTLEKLARLLQEQGGSNTLEN